MGNVLPIRALLTHLPFQALKIGVSVSCISISEIGRLSIERQCLTHKQWVAALASNPQGCGSMGTLSCHPYPQEYVSTYHLQLRLPSWRASNQSLSLGSGLLGTLFLSQEKGCSLLALTPGQFFWDPTQWVYLYPPMPSACQVWGQIVAAWMGRETWFTRTSH